MFSSMLMWCGTGRGIDHMMPKVVLTFRLAHRFMTAKSRRHIPETLEHEQTQQEGHQYGGTAHASSTVQNLRHYSN